MEKASKEMLKAYVDSQKFSSTTEIMDAMKEMFRDVLQQVMESELDAELGYEKSQRTSETAVENNHRNYRNGYSKKTVKMQLGTVEVKVLRDRNREYKPKIIGKYSRNADGMEEKILGLYACGMSQRDISEQLKSLYDVDTSPELVSKISEKIMPEVTAWQNRPLEAVYPFVFLDAIHYKVKDVSASDKWHNILDLFKKLYVDQSIETEQLTGLEFIFFKYFKHTTVPKGLTKYFQDRPTEYVAAILQVYKDDLDTPQKNTELSQNQFGHYFDIIESFTAIPGCNGELVSEEVFRAWINTAQAYADAVNYRRAFGICLGRLLSYAPSGDDRVFPHEIVRNYFEENQKSVVIDHFVMGKLNQRGVYYATAGMEEKRLSKEYRSASEKLWILYPQTASILGSVHIRASTIRAK